MSSNFRLSHASRFRPFARAVWLRYASARRTVRNTELMQIAICAVVGVVVGLATVGLRDLVSLLHRIDFNLVYGAYLSAQDHVDFLRIMIVPALGGLILGVVTLVIQKYRPTEMVDPIEANALYGGNLSLSDSVRMTGYTVISNACGASVGMEAGYSQLGSGIFAWVGSYLHLRREDQRTMVTAGAAAAIAAAFNAPLAGAFYGFELVHGSYTPRLLAPVIAASLGSVLMVGLLGPDVPLFAIYSGFKIPQSHYLLFIVMGVLAAGLGILTMKSATWVERAIRAAKIPVWARPAIGGIILSLFALGSPQVLGSGHGAIEVHLETQWALLPLVLLLFGKVMASAASLGAGFRGGLFSSSLFLGALLGAVCVKLLGYLDPGILGERSAFMLVGMGAVGTAIIGAPFTMIFLVLEATGDFAVTAGVLIGVLVAGTMVRLTFGYSFSTWRFHLRGLPLRGGHDIGWIADLTAQRMMRSDVRMVPASMHVEDMREAIPLGSKKWLFATAADGSYAGVIDVSTVHDPEITELAQHLVAADLTTCKGCYMLPGDDIRTVLKKFSEAQSETLPVVRSPTDLRILGTLSEAYCLKRYTNELERQRRDDLGMSSI